MVIVSEELILGGLIGLIVGVPLWASVGWAVTLLLKLAGGLGAFLAINAMTNTVSPATLWGLITVHKDLLLGLVVGVAIVGLIAAAIRRLDQERHQHRPRE